jgi:glycosyltransferase involved in cell wall biosynthesis
MSKIEFIIPTYNRPHHLMCLLNSLCAQRSDKWCAHVIADCPPEGSLDKVMDYFKDNEKIKFTILPERYNDWGHTPRNYGVEHSTEDWIVMTGEDNYYVPVFVDTFLSVVSEKVGFVFCNMVHNWKNFEYIGIDCEPSWGKIDIGNFMIKRKFAKQMRLNPSIEQADGVYVEEFKVKFPYIQIIKIHKVLYIHN